MFHWDSMGRGVKGEDDTSTGNALFRKGSPASAVQLIGDWIFDRRKRRR